VLSSEEESVVLARVDLEVLADALLGGCCVDLGGAAVFREVQLVDLELPASWVAQPDGRWRRKP
jgi:hypothetical protein